MLNLLSTRTVLPILALLTVSVGCGKKIQDNTKSGRNPSSQNLELSATPGLTLSSFDLHGESYELLKDGSFVLPNELLVQTGTPQSGSKIKITYNKVEEEDYEFHCTYSYPGTGKRYKLVNCESIDERDLGVTSENISNIRWPMDQGKTIEIDFANAKPLTEVKVQAIFQAVWK